MLETSTFSLAETLETERPRLARLCARLTGDLAAADDLAQETLIEAWRNAHKLTDPAGVSAWLSAIARNVCLRWGRVRGRDIARLDDAEDLNENASSDELPVFDFEEELDRSELSTLLDRALELLPAETRAVLISHYISGSPLSEVAGQWGMSEGAVAVRLHRGKIALKKIITTHFHADAASFGLVNSDVHWQETSLWCMSCGQRKLMGYLNAAEGVLHLKCPSCNEADDSYYQNSNGLVEEIAGAKGYKTAFKRLADWSYEYYPTGLLRGETYCTFCHQIVHPRVRFSALTNSHYADASCSACGSTNFGASFAATLGSPAAQTFLRENPRVLSLPERTLAEVDGLPALMIGFESMTSSARFEVVLAKETFSVLRLAVNK